jgi:hypothetical protein
MSEQRVTDLQNLGERPADNDVVHIVDVSDTSQNPAGSSKKVTAGEIREGLAETSVYDPAGGAKQVAFNDELPDTSNFETTTQLNARDTANRDRTNHTGTQTASTISDFQTTVSANTDVTANTAARHDAVTIAGTPNYLTIAGQVITRNLINLASHVTGRLGFGNLPQGTARSVVGRAGSGSGDVANISAGNDTILSRSGSGNVAFNTAATVRTILNVEDGATANSGTVTSVAATVPTGLTISGSPVTTSGTLAIGLDTDRVIPTQATLDSKVDYSLVSEASSATPTATGTALKNDYVATALAVNATLAAPSGTANANGVIRYRITASGGTRTIGYNAALEAGNITRTTSLADGETLEQIYSRKDGEWVCVYEDVT